MTMKEFIVNAKNPLGKDVGVIMPLYHLEDDARRQAYMQGLKDAADLCNFVAQVLEGYEDEGGALDCRKQIEELFTFAQGGQS